ncbi:Gsp Glutathionylspermidine synthase [Rhabdaerophilaceae bacterium]
MKRLSLPERVDWRETAQKLGFAFHTADGQPYWDESAGFSFSLREIEDDIEAPSAELEAMCLEFVAKAITSEQILTSLAIPEAFWGAIHESWSRGDRNLYGRFDLAYAGNEPAKLLEYNADTPTALFETGVFQWVWLEEQIARGVLPAGADQFNSVHEKLIEAFRHLRGGPAYRLHLACSRDSDEDRGTVAYLQDCATQAGMAASFLYMDEIGRDANGRFVDSVNAPIETLFKLYPWEWMFDEEFGATVIGSPTQFIEPIWKSLLSNKGLLPHLWQMAPGHPNLLPAYFAGAEQGDLGQSFVEKPLHSREGANIRLVRDGKASAETDGPYAGPIIRQKLADIPDFGGGYAVIGSWMVASEPAGLLIREDSGPITTNLARFVPHFIAP